MRIHGLTKTMYLIADGDRGRSGGGSAEMVFNGDALEVEFVDLGTLETCHYGVLRDMKRHMTAAKKAFQLRRTLKL